MTDPKEKEAKPPIQTRTPGRLGGRGMFDRVKLPSPGRHPIEELLAGGAEANPADVSPQVTGVPEYRSTGVQGKLPELSPTKSAIPSNSGTEVPQYRSTGVTESPIPKDRFYKKANEIADQVDRTLTPAESKVFEQLLRLSVGFNRETCQVRIAVLMERTGYSSDKTVRTALRGLEIKGRIEKLSSHNSPLGDEYRVLAYSGNYSGTGVPQYRSTPVKNTAVLESKITGQLNTENTIQTDDEIFADLVATLKEVAREVTGREASRGEAERWRELAELLAAELKIIGSRTSISSAPAVLTTHLRRRLQKRDSQQIEREAVEAAAGDSGGVQPPDQARPQLSPEQLQEQVNTVVSMLSHGALIEDIAEQLSGNFRPAQWHMIRSMALVQAKVTDAPANPKGAKG